MTSPLFPPDAPFDSWLEPRETNGSERHLEVFRWENRVAARERDGLNWVTLDVLNAQNPRDFWRQSVETNRVGRAVSISRGFEPKPNARGARLDLEARDFDVLVAPDNGGLARIKGESLWRSFEGTSPRARKPLARVPSVWSARFHTGFARRSLWNLVPELQQESLARLPAPMREAWEEGASARPLRLVAAAVAQGWAQEFRAPMSLPIFWEMVLARAAKQTPRAPQSGWGLLGKPTCDVPPSTLPAAMLKHPALALRGRVELANWHHKSPHGRPLFPAIFRARAEETMLRIAFWPSFDSQHEQLEARLELRDWLGQFFPAREVESWLQPL